MNTYFTKVMLGVFLLNTLSLDLCMAASAAGGCAGGATDTCAPPPSPPRHVAAVAVTPSAAGCGASPAPCLAPVPSGKVLRMAPHLVPASPIGSASTDSCGGDATDTCETDISSKDSTESDEDRLSTAPGSPARTPTGPRTKIIMTLVPYNAKGPEFEGARYRLELLSLEELQAFKGQFQEILRVLPHISASMKAKIITAMTAMPSSPTMDAPKTRNQYIDQLKKLLPKSKDPADVLFQVFALSPAHMFPATSQALRFGGTHRNLTPIIKAIGTILVFKSDADVIEVINASLYLVKKDMDTPEILPILRFFSNIRNPVLVATQALKLAKPHMSTEDFPQIMSALNEIEDEKLATLDVPIVSVMALKKDMTTTDKVQMIQALARASHTQMTPIGEQLKRLMAEQRDMSMTDILLMTRAFAALPADGFPRIAPEILKLLKGRKDIPPIMYALSKVGMYHLQNVLIDANAIVPNTMAAEDTAIVVGIIHNTHQKHVATPENVPGIIAQFQRLLPHMTKTEHVETYTRTMATIEDLPSAHRENAITSAIALMDHPISNTLTNAMIRVIGRIYEEHPSPAEMEKVIEQFKRLLPYIGQAKYTETYARTIAALADLLSHERANIVTGTIHLITGHLYLGTTSQKEEEFQETLRSLRASMEQNTDAFFALTAHAAATNVSKKIAEDKVRRLETEAPATEKKLRDALEPSITKLAQKIKDLPVAFDTQIATLESRIHQTQADLATSSRALADASAAGLDLEGCKQDLKAKTQLLKQAMDEFNSMKIDRDKMVSDTIETHKAAREDLAFKIKAARRLLDDAREDLQKISAEAIEAAKRVAKANNSIEAENQKIKALETSLRLANLSAQAWRLRSHMSVFERVLGTRQKPFSLSPLAADLFTDPDDLPPPSGAYGTYLA